MSRWSCLVVFALVAGCTTPEPDPLPQPPTPEVEKNYERPLPPGAQALRKLAPGEWPDISAACSSAVTGRLREALQHSAGWFEKPSSKAHFPVGDVSYGRAKASVQALLAILGPGGGAGFEQALRERFDCYTSIGCDDQGTVLFTAYYSPIFRASRTRQGEFQHPLYRKPADLIKDPKTGSPKGGTYHTRAELTSKLTDKDAFVYLPSALDAYVVGVNGSAKLRMVRGDVMYVGYEAHNGHEYVSIRKLLVDDGKLGKRDGLPAIQRYFRANPADLEGYLRRNPRFVFLQPYAGDGWPSGSLGVPVTPRRSLATDKAIYPRAGMVLVDTTLPSAVGNGTRPFSQLMVDQDTGGAIRAPGRADIYLGAGPEAERLAGRQAAEGRLYYFFLKGDGR